MDFYLEPIFLRSKMEFIVLISNPLVLNNLERFKPFKNTNILESEF